MVVLEITSESARTNMPVNGAESVVAFMVLILALKFIADWKMDEYRTSREQFTIYSNQIKRGVNGDAYENNKH